MQPASASRVLPGVLLQSFLVGSQYRKRKVQASSDVLLKKHIMDLGEIHTWLHLQISGRKSHLLKSCCGNYWEWWPRSWETSWSWSEGQSYDRTVVIWTVYVFGLAWLTAGGWGIWCLLYKQNRTWLPAAGLCTHYLLRLPRVEEVKDKKPATGVDKYLSPPLVIYWVQLRKLGRNIYLPGAYLGGALFINVQTKW